MSLLDLVNLTYEKGMDIRIAPVPHMPGQCVGFRLKRGDNHFFRVISLYDLKQCVDPEEYLKIAIGDAIEQFFKAEEKE